MDPLSVLRDFNTSNKLSIVQQVEGNVQFGDRYSFPAATPVYKAQSASAYYSLQDVLFYLKNRHLKPQEYVMAANQSGVANINIFDRKKILDVLDGVAALDPSLVPTSAAAAVAASAPREVAAGTEPQAKRQRLATEVDEVSAMKGLMEQERQLRNRNTMLLASNKDFRRVLEVLMDVKRQVAAAAGAGGGGRKHEAAAAAGGKGSAGASARGPSSSSGRQNDPRAGGGGGGGSSSSRYGRDASSDQVKAPGAGGNASSYGTSGGRAAAPPPPPPPPGGGGYVPVRKSGSSAAAAAPPPPPPPPSSSSGARSAKPHSAAAAGGSSKGGSAAAKPTSTSAARGSSGSAAGGGGGKGDGAKKGGVPIIIVPSGLTSMVNMYNARAFLEEGKFIPTAQAAAGGAPKPASVTIRRTAHRSAPGVEYVVTDRPPAPGSPDWDRVVAVLVQGAKWQFKDWPHKGAKEGDLVDALAQVCGFYVHFMDEKVAPPVSDWNVRAVPLHRESRHKDMTAMLQLYRNLDVFLQAKRSTLAY